MVADARVVLKDTKTGITKEDYFEQRRDISLSGFGDWHVRNHSDGAEFSNGAPHRHFCFDKPDHGLAGQHDARSDVRNGHSDRSRCGDAGDILPISGEHHYHKDD